MTYKMNDKQFDSVLQLTGQDRYRHFISKVVDWEELWSLKNDGGFVITEDNKSNKCIPFWPHPSFAKASATEEWADCIPEKIDLSTFMEKWLPGMSADKVLAAIFPTPESKGIVVEPVNLSDDLLAECNTYE